jgi:hypothetical protein
MVQGQKANYQNTIIYKIVCNDLNIKDCYVGHTTNFIKRKYEHKQGCNNEKSKLYNQKNYEFIRANGGWDNWSMIEICKYPCNDKREAESEERRHYELLNSNLNSNRPFVSEEEKKDKHKEISKKYYEEIKEKKNKKYNCECGGKYTECHKARHLRTKKHQKFLENQKK